MKEEIKEERSADEAGKHGNDVVVDVDDLWVKYMEAKLAFKSKHCKPSHPFTICPVPRDIRSVDNVAHDPLVVSIGPYHRGNPSLHEMEEVKWRNLNAFRDRAGKNFNECLKAMKVIEQQARDCYSGNIDMEADEFIEMMLLDGLFLIELFLTGGNFFLEPIYTISGMSCRVGRDMLLLENQLPSFVLESLCNVLPEQWSRFDLWEKACTFIRDYALPFEPNWDLTLLPEIFGKGPGVHHLLHLVHLLLEPKSESTKPTAKPLAFVKKMKNLSFLPPRCRDCFPSPSGQESQSMECTAKLRAIMKKFLPFLSPCKCEEAPLKVIPSAVELDEAGVVFLCVKAKSFFDVKFERGTMKMPRLSVQDSTKPLLRNFISYEQCFPNRGNHITSYCSFMDHLVNTRRDVEILKKSKIIENWLGSDKEVALLFNDLGKGIFLSDLMRGNLRKSLKQIMKHTQKTWPKWQAKLNHDYFSNPWAIISLIAATFVIFLTSVQTYKAAFT